jgi:hypothetical protein
MRSSGQRTRHAFGAEGQRAAGEGQAPLLAVREAEQAPVSEEAAGERHEIQILHVRPGSHEADSGPRTRGTPSRLGGCCRQCPVTPSESRVVMTS